MRVEIYEPGKVRAEIMLPPNGWLPQRGELLNTFPGSWIAVIYPSRLNDMADIDLNLEFAREIKPNKYNLR